MNLWHSGLQEWIDDSRIYVMICDTINRLGLTDYSEMMLFTENLMSEFGKIAQEAAEDSYNEIQED